MRQAAAPPPGSVELAIASSEPTATQSEGEAQSTSRKRPLESSTGSQSARHSEAAAGRAAASPARTSRTGSAPRTIFVGAGSSLERISLLPRAGPSGRPGRLLCKPVCQQEVAGATAPAVPGCQATPYKATLGSDLTVCLQLPSAFIVLIWLPFGKSSAKPGTKLVSAFVWT